MRNKTYQENSIVYYLDSIKFNLKTNTTATPTYRIKTKIPVLLLSNIEREKKPR